MPTKPPSFLGRTRQVDSKAQFHSDFSAQQSFQSYGGQYPVYLPNGNFNSQQVPQGYQLPQNPIRNHNELPQGASMQAHSMQAQSIRRGAQIQGADGQHPGGSSFDNFYQTVWEAEKNFGIDSQNNPQLRSYFPFLQSNDSIMVRVGLNPTAGAQSYLDPYLQSMSNPMAYNPYWFNPFASQMSLNQYHYGGQFGQTQESLSQLYTQQLTEYYRQNGQGFADAGAFSQTQYQAVMESQNAPNQVIMPQMRNGGTQNQHAVTAAPANPEPSDKNIKKTFERTILNDAKPLFVHVTPTEPKPTTPEPPQPAPFIEPENKDVILSLNQRPKVTLRPDAEISKQEPVATVIGNTVVKLTLQNSSSEKRDLAKPAEEPVQIKKPEVVPVQPEIKKEISTRRRAALELRLSPPKPPTPPVLLTERPKPHKIEPIEEPPSPRRSQRISKKFVKPSGRQSKENNIPSRKIVPTVWSDVPPASSVNDFKAEVVIGPLIPKHLENVLVRMVFSTSKPTPESQQKIVPEIVPHQIQTDEPMMIEPEPCRMRESEKVQSAAIRVNYFWVGKGNTPSVFVSMFKNPNDPALERTVWQTTDYSNKKISNVQEVRESEECEEEDDD